MTDEQVMAVALAALVGLLALMALVAPRSTWTGRPWYELSDSGLLNLLLIGAVTAATLRVIALVLLLLQ